MYPPMLAREAATTIIISLKLKASVAFFWNPSKLTMPRSLYNRDVESSFPALKNVEDDSRPLVSSFNAISLTT